jgi:hypothetical protein
MNTTVVSNFTVCNTYIVSRYDPAITVLSICHNQGDYAHNVLVDSRFVNELRNFVWSNGYDVNNNSFKYFYATVTNANRQNLHRLNIFQNERKIFLHRFVVSLETGEQINTVHRKGCIADARVTSLNWKSQTEYNRLDLEYDKIVEETLA